MGEVKIATEAGFYAGEFRKAGQSYVDDAVAIADMTREQLLAEAEKRGVTVKPKASDAEIVDALTAAP